MKSVLSLFIVALLLSGVLSCRAYAANVSSMERAERLQNNVMAIDAALDVLKSTFPADTKLAMKELYNTSSYENLKQDVFELFDHYSLLEVELLRDGGIEIRRGGAEALLVQGGWKNYLVKVVNPYGEMGELSIISPNAEPLFHKSAGNPFPLVDHNIAPEVLAERFLELAIFRGKPMAARLSGEPLEYRILQIYTRVSEAREALFGAEFIDPKIVMRKGGASARLLIAFDTVPATKVVFRIRDQDGSPTMAGFTIADGVQRFVRSDSDSPLPKSYRRRYALRRPWERIWERGAYRNSVKAGERLAGIYPLPAQRLATRDPFPDFYFQAQIYRSDGEYVYLPPGNYTVDISRGPEYLSLRRTLVVSRDSKIQEEEFQLTRWVNLAEEGWYSSDLHVHASGCKHYETPEAGMPPEYMWRQSLGEDLNVTTVLNWGVGWYGQKKYFEQQFSKPLKTDRNLLRYEVEVSEMPSAHLGHLGLWGLKEDDYPGAEFLDQWPSWTLPILRWAKSQQATTGYVHTGWGMYPDQKTTLLPNYALPKMEGIGANEYVVTLTEGVVDLFGVGDTAPIQELNTWYHALNVGYRTRLIGESDFPCISHERIGVARGYAKLDEPLEYYSYLAKLKAGRSYVSDGRSHIVDFKIEGRELGTGSSEVHLTGRKEVVVSAKVIAYLPDRRDGLAEFIANSSVQRQPAWDIERARLGQTRKVLVELVVNGIPVDSIDLEANAKWQDIQFTATISSSSWAALRVYPSSHTNPIFIIVNNKPIRASRRSAEWLRSTVDRLWEVKSSGIREEEKHDALQQYEKAKGIYDKIASESDVN